MKVRCATLNLKGVELDWFQTRAEALLRGLRPLKLDLICFQETTIRQDTPLYNQARSIGTALGLEYSAFAPYGNILEIVSRDHGGIAVVSRWPMLDVRARRLIPGHPADSDSRVALFTEVKTPGGCFGVVTSHLSWMPDQVEIRLTQAGLIFSEMDRIEWFGNHGRYLLMGDFNATDREPCIKLAEGKLIDAHKSKNPSQPGFTWSSQNRHTRSWNLPDRRIDYIFCSRNSLVNECHVILDEGSPDFASDHFGVFAELEWSP